jgi:uncharacterized protein (DUF433 family)
MTTAAANRAFWNIPTWAGEMRRPMRITPLVAFGRPVLTGTGIPTRALGDPFKGGESVHELTEQYGVPSEPLKKPFAPKAQQPRSWTNDAGAPRPRCAKTCRLPSTDANGNGLRSIARSIARTARAKLSIGRIL